MSKPFTATAILMLSEEGALSLDDSVSQFLPGFAGVANTLEILKDDKLLGTAQRLE